MLLKDEPSKDWGFDNTFGIVMSMVKYTCTGPEEGKILGTEFFMGLNISNFLKIYGAYDFL
jgi:hypothetical protein